MKKLNITRKTKFILMLIIILSLIINLFFVPHFHRWYTDEPDAIEKAKTIITGEDFSKAIYKHPIGWSYFLTIPFILFGLSSKVALYTSSILASLTVINIFLISFLLTKNKTIALFSSFIYLFLRVPLVYSGTAVNNIASTFFLTLSVALMVYSYERKEMWLNTITIILIGFTALFRTENYFIFAYYILGFFIFSKQKENLGKIISVLLIVIILTIPNLSNNLGLYLNNDLASGNTGDENASNWSLNNFFQNKDTFTGLISNSIHPIFFTILYLCGIVIGMQRYRKESVFLLLWIIPVLSSFIPYFHAPLRFLIGIYPFLAIFAGITINRIITIFSRKEKVLSIIFILLIVISFTPGVKRVSADIWPPHELETQIPGMLKNELKEDCTIITIVPSVIKSTTQFPTISAINFIEKKQIPETECILFFEDMFCDGTFNQAPECSYMKDNYKSSVYKKYSNEYKTYYFYLIQE